MKRLLSAALAAGVGLAFAGKPVELENAGFERVGRDGVPVGWTAHPNWRAERAGHNGSGGYTYECRDPKDCRGGRPGQDVKLEPGKRYVFSALVRADGLATERKSPKQGIGLYLEGWDASKKWLFGAASKPPMASGTSADWVKVEGLTPVIPDTIARAQIQPWVSGKCIGRAMIDNVYVEEYEMEPVEGVYSDRYRREGVSGPATFHAVLNTDLRANGLSDYAATFAYTAKNGAAKTAPGEIVSGTHARFTVPVEALAFGRHDVVCTLSLGGRVLGSGRCDFTRVATPTPRKVRIDEHLRTIVDGKPFFPLGMYFSRVTESNLQHYTRAPFNVVMPYGRPEKAQFDLCQKYGVKVIYNLQGAFGDKDMGRAWMTARMAEFKDHPALLAWYTNDERPLSDIPRLTARQGVVEEFDGDHPTWSVQDVYTELSHYLPTYDILGMDPYPIGRKMPIGRCVWTMRQADRDAFGTRAVWHVPQAFGWNWLERQETRKMVAPNARELDNMTWQAVAGGANGLVFYSYFDLAERPHATKNNDDELTWADMCALAKRIRKYEDVLLALPGPRAEDVPEAMAVRTWKKDGALWVLAVNCTTDPVKASVKIPRVRLGKIAQRDFGPAPRTAGRDTIEFDFGPMDFTLLKFTVPTSAR